jgi:glutaconyl-CoA/methylmalonyl-CoA decarboxylase subunit gamma
MSEHVLRVGGREYKAEVKELTPDRATIIVNEKAYIVELVQVGKRRVTGESVRGTAPATPVYVPSPAPVPAQQTAPVAAPPPPAPAPVAAPPVAAPAAAPAQAPRPPAGRQGEGAIIAPMPGLVLSLKVKEGDTVQAGRTLLVMEAMKMENAITSPYAGVVSKVYVRDGDVIGEGDLLVDVARPKMTTL